MLIKWMYGFDELTNQVHGHGSASIRAKGNVDEIDGLDVERTLGLYDGSYTKDQRRQVQDNSIYEKLLSLRVQVEGWLKNNLNLKNSKFCVSEPNIKVSQDPNIEIKIDGHPIKIRLKLGLAGVNLSPAFMPTTNNDAGIFIERIDARGATHNKGAGPYIIWRNYANQTECQTDANVTLGINDDEDIRQLVGEMVDELVENLS